MNFCGPLDENIHAIEKNLEITISRNGFQFDLSGSDHKIKTASDLINHFYEKANAQISLEEIQLSLISITNERLNDEIELVELLTKKNDLQGRTPRQQSYLKHIQENDINFGIGPAGTGKTYLAVASAIDALNREKIKRIILVRPAVEAGEKLGFLPGDLAQKVDPYLRPLYDSLYDLFDFEKIQRMIEIGDIEIAPLAFMRGRTLKNSFAILDEAQNATDTQIKMFLTRIGENSKIVVNGDPTQIDLPNKSMSGLVRSKELLGHLNEISVVDFDHSDVVRHPLVSKIVKAYSNND